MKPYMYVTVRVSILQLMCFADEEALTVYLEDHGINRGEPFTVKEDPGMLYRIYRQKRQYVEFTLDPAHLPTMTEDQLAHLDALTDDEVHAAARTDPDNIP